MPLSTTRTAFALAFAIVAFPALAEIDVDTINNADPLASQEKPAMIRLQVLLDRAGASVGPIDGVMGDATSGAIAAYEEMQGFEVDGELDEQVWNALKKDTDAAAQRYEITDEDAGLELTESIPDNYADMAKLDRLGYLRHSEALAERFHMSEDLLRELNPDAEFGQAGTAILVAKPGAAREATVRRIMVDKAKRRVAAYDGEGEGAKLVFSAPAAVGSDEMPSPSGTMKVAAIAPEPNYTFDPKNIPEAETDETLVIAPGPNGPVGGTWIDLSKPTYGIHGTPEPASIFSAQSHGCVRLANWDVANLAQMVEAGETEVTFK